MRKSHNSSRKKIDKRLFIIGIVIFTEAMGFNFLLPFTFRSNKISYIINEKTYSSNENVVIKIY